MGEQFDKMVEDAANTRVKEIIGENETKLKSAVNEVITKFAENLGVKLDNDYD